MGKNRDLYLFHDTAGLPLHVCAKEEMADEYLKVLALGGWRETSKEAHAEHRRTRNRAYFHNWRQKQKAYIKDLEQRVADLSARAGEEASNV